MSLVKTAAYFVVPLCIVSATEKFGYRGVLFVFIPIILLYSIGIRVFEKKEVERTKKFNPSQQF